MGFHFLRNLFWIVLMVPEHAMTQDHALKAAELSMRAQELADH